MSTNASNGDDRQPFKTEVVIPGENVVVDHWMVSSGSAVRAKDTIAYVRKRGDGANETSAAPTVVAPKHKRPTRRKKFKKTDNKPQASNGSTTTAAATTTTKSSAMSLKDLLAAKNKNVIEPLATTTTTTTTTTTKSTDNDVTMETKTEDTKSAPSFTTSTKARQLMPIHAPASGILRIHSAPSSDNPQRRLVIGVIEECLHPTYVDGMCVVCGAPKPKETKDSQTTNNNGSRTLKVTVSGGVTMTVSQRESESMALLDSDRLFKQKRLSLVLDLDHTLVHATADTRARQYLDPSRPVGVPPGDVRTISLPMFEGADNKQKDPRHKHMRSQHFVKLRPFVKEFLEGVRQTYEVSVYTAGTRQYAEEIAMVLCRKLAGADMDADELERLRQTVQLAEKEYDRTLENEKKRAAETTNIKMAEGAPPRKKKKVSFQTSEVANGSNGDNHDSMTQQKLSTLQAELLAAEALESKAKTLRQSVFGSRIISRTDVGDLGRDVKSLKRVFPCGGTMAAVVDDREDVWANAKDNSKGTIRGEPPDNLLLVRPYHWQPFVGFADVNNAAGADLSGSGPAKQDKQLLHTKDILEKLHKRYFKQSAEGNRQTVPDTLKQMRKEVLMGSHIVLSGLVPLHKQGIDGAVARPHFVRYAQNLGAKVRNG